MIPPLKLVDDNGAEYEADSGGYMLPGSIGLLDTLYPSVRKVGFIVFDAPPDKNYRLKLSGGYWSNENALVRLKPEGTMQRNFSKSASECLKRAAHTTPS